MVNRYQDGEKGSSKQSENPVIVRNIMLPALALVNSFRVPQSIEILSKTLITEHGMQTNFNSPKENILSEC